jgi:hypothetical protein
VLGYWHKCTSEHYLVFSKCSEQEMKLVAAELRRRNQQHRNRFTLNANKIANFLRNLGEKEKELQQQRKRDAELRKSQSRIEAVLSGQVLASSKVSESDSLATNKIDQESVGASYRLVESDNTDDASALETYEDYK